jgi:hypothetical protein
VQTAEVANTAVSTGAVLAGGGDIATMRNQHGVVIDLTDTSRSFGSLVTALGKSTFSRDSFIGRREV